MLAAGALLPRSGTGHRTRSAGTRYVQNSRDQRNGRIAVSQPRHQRGKGHERDDCGSAGGRLEHADPAAAADGVGEDRTDQLGREHVASWVIWHRLLGDFMEPRLPERFRKSMPAWNDDFLRDDLEFVEVLLTVL